MKKSNLLLLLVAGVIIFTAGLVIQVRYTLFRDMLIIAGTFLVLLFYWIVLIGVIKSHSISPANKILWMVIIICLPVIGNLIYIVFSEMADRPQHPKVID